MWDLQCTKAPSAILQAELTLISLQMLRVILLA